MRWDSARFVTAVCSGLRRAAIVGLKTPVVLYRWVISPLIGPRCRFLPTCSEYALIAIERFGPIKGSWLTLKRLVRCQPLCEGGFDPVPPKPGERD